MGLTSLVKSQTGASGLSGVDLLLVEEQVGEQVTVSLQGPGDFLQEVPASAEARLVHQRVFGDGCARLSNIFIPLPDSAAGGPLSYAHLRRLRLKRRKTQRPISWVEDEMEVFHTATSTAGASSLNLNRFRILQQIRLAHLRRIPSRVRVVEEAFEERRRVREEEGAGAAMSAAGIAASTSNLYKQLHPVETAAWEDFIIYDEEQAQLGQQTMGPWIQVKPLARPPAHKYPPRPSLLVPTMVQPGSGLLSPLMRPGSGSMMALNTSQSPSLLASQLVSPAASRSLSASGSSLGATSHPPQPPLNPNSNILRMPRCPATRVLNPDLAQGRWVEAICWEEERLPSLLPPLRLCLTVADPTLCLEIGTAGTANVSAKDLARLNRMIVKAKASKRLPAPAITATSAQMTAVKQINFARIQAHDPLNLSLDRHYERKRSSAHGEGGKLLDDQAARGATSIASGPAASSSLQAVGSIGSSSAAAVLLQHSVPALRLTWPQYRTQWTRQEIRRWHRPHLSQPPMQPQAIGGCKPPPQLRKQEAIANGLIRSLKRLTLRDAAEFALVEYSEEFPLTLMNAGMGTRLLAYARLREGETGEVEAARLFAQPPAHGGVWQRLTPNDPSPFWQFGNVQPGHVQLALTNNLFRAPCWPHPTAPTDFLLIRQCRKGQVEAKWSIRELPPTVLVVGQVLPLHEVAQPHSRRYNQFCRARVQVAAYRLFHRKRAGEEGILRAKFLVGAKLKITKLSNMFPQFSDGSMRKWLKEYADSQRAGTGGSGTWSLRPDAPRLSEDDLRQLVPPEAVCLYESMLIGQQCLQDAGVLLSGDLGEEDDRQEVRMAPWNRTAAFVAACAGKAQLRLSGADDEYQLSMIRMPTRLTKQEKERLASGTAGTEAVVLGPDGRLDRQERERLQVSHRQQLAQIWDRQLKWLSAATTASAEARSPARPATPPSTVEDGSRLVITRFRDTVNGPVIETETLTDARLIAMYLKARQQWQEKRNRKQVKEANQSLKRASSLSQGNGGEVKAKRPRKPKEEGGEASEAKKNLTIRCGTCGQQGHMRTNRICPMYAVYEASLLPDGSAPPKAPKAANAKTVKKPPTPTPLLSPEQQAALAGLNNLFHQILTQLSGLPMAWPFVKPVNRKEYPHYYAIIAQPIDLSTMKIRCKRQVYRTRQSFWQDLERIHMNCLTFNLADHPFTGMAWDLIEKGKELLERHSPEIDRLEQNFSTTVAAEEEEVSIE